MNRTSIVRTAHAPSADLPVNTNWRTRAACKDADPDLFFPIGSSGMALLQAQEAKGICRGCPVMDTCLQWALETGQEHGVWGGLSEDERRRMKRRSASNRARKANA